MKTMQHKTIRMGLWESNSSSSHSLTIETKGRKGDKKVRPLVEDNVLYASRLEDYSVYAGENSATCCGDVESKAAMVAQWIQANIEQGDSEEEIDLGKCAAYLAEKLGYSSIVFERGYADYSPYCEYADIDFNLSGIWEDDKEVIDRMIKVILDDTKEIIDSESSY